MDDAEIDNTGDKPDKPDYRLKILIFLLAAMSILLVFSIVSLFSESKAFKEPEKTDALLSPENETESSWDAEFFDDFEKSLPGENSSNKSDLNKTYKETPLPYDQKQGMPVITPLIIYEKLQPNKSPLVLVAIIAIIIYLIYRIKTECRK